jgi:hypothetical protein
MPDRDLHDADTVQGFRIGRPGTLDAVRLIASEIATG